MYWEATPRRFLASKVRSPQLGRCFVALSLAPTSVAQLEPMVDGAKARFPMVRWVEPRQLHLTLVFLAQADPAELNTLKIVMDQVAGASSLEPVQLQGMGRFPARGRPKILWFGISPSSGVETFHSLLSHELKVRRVRFDNARFRSHVTIGRVRDPNRRPAPLAEISELFRFDTDVRLDHRRIDLIESELSDAGPRHTVVHSVRLGPAQLGEERSSS